LEDSNAEVRPRYSKLAKTMHWGFVVIFAYGVSKQVDSITELADPSKFRVEIIFGVAFVILLFVRFAYMKKTQRSALAENTSQLQKIAAKFVHMGMYVSLGSIAMTGLAIGGLYWLGLQEGLIIEAVISIHEFSVSATYWLVAVHILGAIFHRFKNDGVWTAMVPFSKESS
jgi:cytochrome b561